MKVVKELTMELVEPASFRAARPSVFVGKTRRGNRVFREQRRALAGLFVSRAQALKYALFETRDHQSGGVTWDRTRFFHGSADRRHEARGLIPRRLEQGRVAELRYTFTRNKYAVVGNSTKAAEGSFSDGKPSCAWSFRERHASNDQKTPSFTRSGPWRWCMRFAGLRARTSIGA